MTENRMELFIETLTGSAFELSCSPLETIVSIKAKIQYSEGIPVSQQHLIWKSQELNDDLCLQDYSITDGATLKLVLGMRGGPINTRQVSDTKKLKDLAEYVERSSEAGSSNGRPLTVLVFHDGDKVHMYTLLERGDCTVSPLSGTVSETSSIASIKHIEELDQEIVKENEITRDKIAQLQEQLKALSINRSKKDRNSSAHPKNNSVRRKPTSKNQNSFHLPPLERIDAFDSKSKQYSSKDAQSGLPFYSLDLDTKTSSVSHNVINETSKCPPKTTSQDSHAALNLISNSVSTYILSSPDKSSLGLKNSSSFLPYITSGLPSSVKDTVPRVPSQPTRLVAINMSRCSSQDSIIKYDFSRAKKTHKRYPLTSDDAVSSQKFLDLDSWLKNRPKTTPEKSSRVDYGEKQPFQSKLHQSKRKWKNSIKNSVFVGMSSSSKPSMLMQMLDGHSDVSYDLGSPVAGKETKPGILDKSGIRSLVASSIRAFKENSPDTSPIENKANLISIAKNFKISPKSTEEIKRPSSGKKLPLIKTKKKSYKRCTTCSKKTGLATSYTCRCGKNFCASHRYAETHHCTYDYKTEGRRLLQLNNPVVTASKLPKI
ncbi:AN1-type zinc finger protein 4 [Parasteatoda tepidariorum]|uniref:AN1-type zinc finger protein 4 n=1 Tax=Parasteatoda tepidariorum TaxID=114398 RepID=UPI00077F87E8|nr:AN1-type zinc finger protein 4 [Parasteatoda tepidariorum]